MFSVEFQAYGYVAATIFLTVALYSYIYHLYKNRRDADGHDYEEYSNMALHDGIEDTPVNSLPKDDKK